MAFTTDGIKISALPKAQTGKLDKSYLLCYIDDNGNKNYQIPFENISEKLAKELIDEEFMPNSDNAQSGKGIAKMIEELDLDNRFNQKADKEYVKRLKEKLESELAEKASKEELESAREELKEKIREVEEELHQEITDTEQRLNDTIESAKEELRDEIKDTETKLQGGIDEAKNELQSQLSDQKEQLTKLESGETLDDEVTADSNRGVKSSGIYNFVTEQISNYKVDVTDEVGPDVTDPVSGKGVYNYIDKNTVDHYREHFEHSAEDNLANVKGSRFILKNGIIPNNIIIRSITLHPSNSSNVAGWAGPVYLRINGTAISENIVQLQNATNPVTWTFDNILLNTEGDITFEWLQENKQSEAWGAIRVDYINDGTSRIIDNQYVNYCIPLIEVVYANANETDESKLTTKKFVIEAINDRASQITNSRFEEMETRLGDIITEVQKILENFLTKKEADELYLRGAVLYEDELPPESERRDNFNYFLIEDESTKYVRFIRDLSDPTPLDYNKDCPIAKEIDINLNCSTGKAYTDEANIIITNVPSHVVVRINGEIMRQGNNNPYEIDTLGVNEAWFQKLSYELASFSEDFVNGILAITPIYKITVDLDKEMILNISIPSDEFELDLFNYVGGNDVDNALVDWGDKSDAIVVNALTESLSHTYSTAGDYQLKIYGAIKWKGISQAGNISSLSKCLTSIELPTNDCPIVDVLKDAFTAFTSLKSIPVGLFDNCTATKSFDSCFWNCAKLSFIPDGLFDKCTEATNLRGCFSECRSLQSIPKGLFDNCTKVTDLSYCFHYCSSLRFIPEGLFDNNTLVIDFNRAFDGCTSLQAIPEHLFDNNTLVTHFELCFNDCSAVTSNLPTLWISHPNAGHVQCFNYCDKADNYGDAYAAGWANSPAPAKQIKAGEYFNIVPVDNTSDEDAQILQLALFHAQNTSKSSLYGDSTEKIVLTHRGKTFNLITDYNNEYEADFKPEGDLDLVYRRFKPDYFDYIQEDDEVELDIVLNQFSYFPTRAVFWGDGQSGNTAATVTTCLGAPLYNAAKTIQHYSYNNSVKGNNCTTIVKDWPGKTTVLSKSSNDEYTFDVKINNVPGSKGCIITHQIPTTNRTFAYTEGEITFNMNNNVPTIRKIKAKVVRASDERVTA